MRRGPVILRRATYAMVAAMVATSALDMFQGAVLNLGDGSNTVFRWSMWLFITFGILNFTGMAAFAEHATDRRARWLAIVGMVAAGTSIMGGEVVALLRWLVPGSQLPFHVVNSASLTAFSIAFALIWIEGTLDRDETTPTIIQFGVGLLPLYWIITSSIHQMGSMATFFLVSPLAILSFYAAFLCVRQIRERGDPAGLETEFGVELVSLSILWRVALVVVASVASAFVWQPDTVSAAGLATGFGLFAFPAAFGASRMAEQIVRETEPKFSRASMLFSLAGALWLGQIGWLLLMGEGLGTFWPSATAVVVEVLAWHTYREALADWSRNEGDHARASLCDSPRLPIFAAGVVLVAAFVTAFFSIDAAVWVVAVGGLFAAVAAYQLSMAIRSTHRIVRSATYLEA